MLKKLFVFFFMLSILSACSKTSVPHPIVDVKTNEGTFTLELFSDLAPETVKNFVELAKQGKYENVPFHRVIKNFMIQGGDFTNKNGTGGSSYKGEGTLLNDEFGKGLSNVRGTIAMANRGPNTNGSQFFINLVDNTYLDGKHPVFGKVIKGMDMVDNIGASKTGANDRPVKEILMKKVSVNLDSK